MRIAIIGASRGIGAELVKQARAGGHHAVAVARRMESQAAADLTPIEGSILDPSIAKRAIEGADAVAWCVGVKTLGPAALRKVTIFSEGTQRIIEAMKGAGVKRLAVITGIGAGESRGHGGFLYDWIALPLIIGAIYADKNRQEAIVKNSGLDWILVRPSILNDKPGRGTMRALTDLSGFHGGGISRVDVATFVVEQVRTNAWLHRAPLITW